MINKDELTYGECKKRIFKMTENNDEFDGNQANVMILEASGRALDSLDDDDYHEIKEAQAYLVDEVKKLGEKTALELIASVGNWLNERME